MIDADGLAPDHPNANEWRMLCAIARDVVAAAREHGHETMCFRGYRLVASRVGETGDGQVKLTLFRDEGRLDGVCSAVALLARAGTASVIAQPRALGRAACREEFPAG